MTLDTTQSLAQMTDEGLFERIATAILRIADSRCSALSHPGVNAKGRTRKAPVDGIGYVRDADPPHLIAVHHTTTSVQDLRKKWLHDPLTVKPRKQGGKPTGQAGDLIKTAEIVAKERTRTPNLRATLILTTNEEPGDEVLRDVKHAGVAYNIEIEVWSRSRFVHVLDTDPDGQWVRRQFLGIEQDRLSKELLAELSCRSQDLAPLPDDPRARVTRALDKTIALIKQPVTFLVAGSGFGKSVACYRALHAHTSVGGFGLVLSHELVIQEPTLDQAVMATLCKLHPALAPGQSPLKFCTPENPLLVIVEDINRSSQPQRLVEKIAGWTRAHGGAKGQSSLPWRLICPVWPQVLTIMSDQMSKLIQPMLIFPDPLTLAEGRSAVLARAVLAKQSLTDVVAEAISTALGHDPLLIGLHDMSDIAADPHNVIGQFVEGALQRAHATSNETAADFRMALMNLAGQMLLHRCVDVHWRALSSWSLLPDTVLLIKSLSRQAEVFRLSGPSTDQRLLFRHDRVRDWLLIEAASELDSSGTLKDELLAEPYFAEVMGAMLIRRDTPSELVARVKLLNPLALFHALRLSRQAAKTGRARIVNAIEDWLVNPVSRGPANLHLQWAALAVMEETDGDEVPRIVTQFPEVTTWGQLACLRNGDIYSGIIICANFSPGDDARFRDRQIAHAKERFGDKFIHGLDHALRRPDLDNKHRSGLLRLVGHVCEHCLAPAIAACWKVDESRDELLSDYMWAFSQSVDPSNAFRYLDPLCAAWAALPDKADEKQRPSPRDELAVDDLRFGFARIPPVGALDYFIHRASQADLNWQIAYMLHQVDHPKVVALMAETLAAMRRITKDTPFTLTLTNHWSRRQREQGIPMSSDSREVLRQLWKNAENDLDLRIAAFDIWAATNGADDLNELRGTLASHDFADRILQQRLDRSDMTAIPAMIKKLSDRTRGYVWWYRARKLWSPALSKALDDTLARRAANVAKTWNNTIEEDWITMEMVMRLPAADAEQMLVKHWDHLKFASQFVQAALYVCTPELCCRAAIAVAECPEPTELFKYISRAYGVNTVGRYGITCEAQILALEPFLDFISVNDMSSFADACNKAGWFFTRKRLFDTRINNWRYGWSAVSAAGNFDELVANNRTRMIDYEIDQALKTGAEWSEYLRSLEQWLAERRSIAALRLVAGALAHIGSRQELAALKIHDGMPREEAQALIQDTTFAVQLRTPN